MLLHDLVVEGDTQTWLVRYRDEAAIDDWLLDSFDQRIPPRHVHGVILHSQEIIRGGYRMYSGHARHRRASEVHGHSDAVFFGHVTDLLRLENAARRSGIGMNKTHGM